MNKKVLIILSSIIIFTITIVVYLNTKSPNPNPYNALPNNTPSQQPPPITPITTLNPPPLTPITYTGPLLEPPETMSIFQSTPTPLETYAQILANSKKLPTHPDIPGMWQSTDQSQTLTTNPHTHAVKYSLFEPQPIPDGIVSIDPARNAATSFIGSIGLTQQQIIPSDAVYTDLSPEPQSSQPDEAGMIIFKYDHALDGYPALYNNQPAGAASVWVRYDNQVIKAVFTPPPFQTNPSANTNIISLNQALNQIQSGSYSIVYIQNPTSRDQIDQDQIRSITLDDVRLEYRQPQNSAYYYPYYNFRGTVVSNDTYQVQIITPASQ